MIVYHYQRFHPYVQSNNQNSCYPIDAALQEFQDDRDDGQSDHELPEAERRSM